MWFLLKRKGWQDMFSTVFSVRFQIRKFRSPFFLWVVLSTTRPCLSPETKRLLGAVHRNRYTITNVTSVTFCPSVVSFHPPSPSKCNICEWNFLKRIIFPFSDRYNSSRNRSGPSTLRIAE